jgi:ribosome-binding ATPase YchF (GTP1/OBG family)
MPRLDHIPHGTKAAAGGPSKIHTDFERGFIRAEIVPVSRRLSSRAAMASLPQKGLIRSEGKDYVMEGRRRDACFRFNV